MKFDDYVQQRGFNLERTRCGQIARIYETQIASHRGGTPADQRRVDDLENFLKGFMHRDDDFTEQIELVMDKALGAVDEINDHVRGGRTAEARQCQANFVRQYEAESGRLKNVIKEMNLLGNRLIDAL